VNKPVANMTWSAAEGEARMARVHLSDLPQADAETVEWVIRMYCHVVIARQEATIPTKRLRSLLFGKPPAPSPLPAAEEPVARGVLEADAESEALAPRASPVELQKPERATGKGGHRPGPGRLGAAAYAGATRVACRHDELAVGQRCPVCGQGNLSALPAGVEIRIDGNALLSAIRYALEKLRCAACGEIFTAGLPAGVGKAKYSAHTRAARAVSRSDLGGPGDRLEGDQAMLGGPVPDATQWDESEVVGDCAYKVFAQMEKEAAQGERLFPDDTGGRIVSLSKENRDLLAAAQGQGLSKAKERPGMHTTALAVQVGEHAAILYYSSRRHAGENLQGLFDKREAGLAKPLAMSEALARNEVADDAMRSRCHGLAHGRRKCSDLEEVFPHECQVVLELIRQVFDHDEQARQAQLSPEARRASHPAQSQALLDELKRWLDRQMDEQLVEPNSSLGKAIAARQSPGRR
jgi:hypothetical protein